jgi:methylmalonyl-CoA/ethylmalonyl-CoA epimerase
MFDTTRIAEILDALPAEVRPLSTGLDHLGVAVTDLDATLPLYHEMLGLELLYTETVESDKVRVAVLEFGGGHLELLEPTHEDSPVAKFIERRGAGLHHVALRVNDCAMALRAVGEAGFTLIDEVPRTGAGGKQIGFLHPKSTGGVLLELCQPGS